MADPAASAAGRQSTRIVSFDGARGLMSLLVMFWHAFLIVSPSIQVWMIRSADPVERWWWALLVPQFLAQAIVIFFMLSGVVVTMPALRPRFSWRAYYPSRLLRLYLPSWASILFGTLLILAVPRGVAPMTSWLGYTNATHVDAGAVLWQSTLLSQNPSINNPLWSITWEVVFSAFLPLYVLVARWTARWWLSAIAGAVLVAAIGNELHLLAVMYLPTFLIGSIAAANIVKVRAAAAAIAASRLHTLWWSLILVGSLASVLGYRLTESLELVKPFTLINHVLSSTTVLGYMGFLFLAIGSGGAIRLLTSRVARWLGVRSFSLYLVHVPILATLAFVLVDHQWWVPAIGLPLSVAVAAVFSRLVEQPAHRFAKAMGRRVDARWRTRYSTG